MLHIQIYEIRNEGFIWAGLWYFRASSTEVIDLVQKAMQLGALAAIRSEEYAAAHPEEIARRRRFFRRLLGECRRIGRLDEARVQA